MIFVQNREQYWKELGKIAQRTRGELMLITGSPEETITAATAVLAQIVLAEMPEDYSHESWKELTQVIVDRFLCYPGIKDKLR